MTQQPRSRYSGQTIDEWMEVFPSDIDDIGIGLDEIIGGGREGFGLEGEDFMKFMRRAISRLLDVGGIPIKGVGKNWVPETKYGTDRESIITGVINDWLASGGKDPEWGEYWFGLPKMCEESYWQR